MSNSTGPVRIAQLSDTHFLEESAEAEGGFSYDTTAAFDAVHTHLEQQDDYDLIVVTGDVADHGRPAQYRLAAEAFGRFSAPVNVCPGNHDQDATFAAGIGRPTVGTSRAIEAQNWCFLFVDSNAGIMVPDETGRPVDPDNYNDRLHRNGALGQREASWVRDMCSTTDAEHVFIWVHHPPAPPQAIGFDGTYASEWQTLLTNTPKVRGMGGGHTHVPDHYQFHDRPVYVSPALKNNFDLVANTLLPPGYRSYEFAEDGSIVGDLHMVDDVRWPRSPLGRAVIALFSGELSQTEFDEIVQRKRAERAQQSS